ncbi:MAG: DUF305 domain-containing protein [Vicinamibacterales bacterium]
MQEHDRQQSHYQHLAVMAALSYLAMYMLMYAMVDTIGHVYMNFNQVYMAGLMTAPMVVIELLVMRAMYHNGRRNAVIVAASIVAGVAMFVLIRQQTAISDQQFLRSMIPHHSGAILMCQDASIQDPEIRELCKAIVTSQQAEIDQMTAKLRALDSDR